MSSGVHVIEGIEDEIEGGEPFEVELFVFDIGMIGNEGDILVERLGDLFGDDGFGLLDMFMSKEELTVEVAEIDGVQIDDVDLAKASEDEVLEEFAADATGAD